jgi:hypothetical protein
MAPGDKLCGTQPPLLSTMEHRSLLQALLASRMPATSTMPLFPAARKLT